MIDKLLNPIDIKKERVPKLNLNERLSEKINIHTKINEKINKNQNININKKNVYKLDKEY